MTKGSIKADNFFLYRDVDHYYLCNYIPGKNNDENFEELSGEFEEISKKIKENPYKDSKISDKYDILISEYVRILKNSFGKENIFKLKEYSQKLSGEIRWGITQIIKKLGTAYSPDVIVAVPRSKATFAKNQLYLIKAISDAVPEGIENGAYFIERHTSTRTTHLMNTRSGDVNELQGYHHEPGEAPYKGITADTCNLNGSVKDKNVILIDDIYTWNVDIDEDCIQFLFDNGAKNVVLFTLCKTNKGRR